MVAFCTENRTDARRTFCCRHSLQARLTGWDFCCFRTGVPAVDSGASPSLCPLLLSCDFFRLRGFCGRGEC